MAGDKLNAHLFSRSMFGNSKNRKNYISKNGLAFGNRTAALWRVMHGLDWWAILCLSYLYKSKALVVPQELCFITRGTPLL